MRPHPSLPAKFVSLSLLLFLQLGTVSRASPIISEFMADNTGSIKDEDGDYSDWIEIRNTSPTGINLGSFTLTDDPAVRDKWTFPTFIIPGNGYAIVFASGKDRAAANSELHTNFSLASSGGHLAIFHPNFADPLSAFENYPQQIADVSWGEAAINLTETVIDTGASCRWFIPNGPINNWNSRTFADSFFTAGTTGVGYEDSSSNTYDPLIGIGSNVLSPMFNQRTSAYIRIPFNLSSTSDISSLLLRMKFDDGFAAYINGQLVTSSRAPASPAWNSLATLFHDDDDAVVFEHFEIDPVPSNLIIGQNVLAIQGFNRALDSSDFIILPELDVTTSSIEPGATGFHSPSTPGEINNPTVNGVVADTKFSVNRGFYSSAFSVVITTATEGAQIRYTTNGSEPTATSGSIYTGPINVSTTTVLRAAAFRDGYAPTNVDTQTYIFTNTVRAQPTMDTDITNNASYSNLMDTALSGNIPTVSIATLDSGFFGAGGIYTNSENSGRAAEVPISMEYFTPSGDEQFQIDAGIRIHGGNARSHPKKPLRLYFRRDYGDAKLRFPLFPGSPVDEFDQLLLRGGGHDSWSLATSFGRGANDLPVHGTIMRDQFLRRCEVEMGILSPRGKYVHVYINGTYWGVYDLHERANEDFFADHGGGPSEDYDVLHHPETGGQDHSLVSGTVTAWEEMMDLANAGITNQMQYEAIGEYLDIDSYIIAMFTRMWSGDFDWCGPIFQDSTDQTVFDNKNWYAGRRSRNNGGDGKFKFFCWDAEMSMGLHLMFNLNLEDIPQRVTNFDLTQANDPGSPVALYRQLRNNREFRLRFADLLQKHLFNEGVMSPANNLARLSAMENEIEDAMIAESARWGDEGQDPLDPSDDVFDRNNEWRSEVDWLKNTFIAGRNATLISQFRSRGIWPSINAPTFSRRSGEAPAGSTVTLSGAGGTIYYTTDGSDPRIPGGATSPSALVYSGPISLQGNTATIHARVRASSLLWSPLDEATYILGQAASASNLAITEFHYHPANPKTAEEIAISTDDTDFEFIEITNTSNATVTLTGTSFTQGVSFDFDSSAAFQQIATGARILVVNNRDAFLARYGQSLAPLIAGTFANDSKLSNNGESITLNDAFGEPISSFTYSDSEPWPSTADGDGPSLVLNDPIASINEKLPTSWRPSSIPGGTPGSTAITDYASWAAAYFDLSSPDFATISASSADPDGDGWPNLVEFALGRSPLSADTGNPISPEIITVFVTRFPGVTYSFQPGLDAISISVESSTDLTNWSTSNISAFGAPHPQPDGTSLATFRSTIVLDPEQPKYFRLRIESQ